MYTSNVLLMLGVDIRSQLKFEFGTGLGPEYLVLVIVVLEYLISVLVLILRPLGT